MQENTDRQLNKIRKTMDDEMRSSIKEIEAIQKTQTEILELKNKIIELKSSGKSFNSR